MAATRLEYPPVTAEVCVALADVLPLSGVISFWGNHVADEKVWVRHPSADPVVNALGAHRMCDSWD